MIRFIDNQTVKFKLSSADSDCGCTGQPYCQPVRFTDESQFQIKGNIVNSDPEFADEYIGWETWVAVELSYASSNISDPELCDGEIIATASLGSGSGYEYSIDGGAFSPVDTFSGLCEGSYLIVAKDSDGHYASIYATVGGYFDCTLLAGSDANDVLTLQSDVIKNCFANNLI